LECLDALRRSNPAEVSKLESSGAKTMSFLLNLWNDFREELESSGQFEEVPFRDLKMDHLDYRRSSPGRLDPTDGQITWPDTHVTFNDFEKELQELRRGMPEERALICGSSPKKRIVLVPRADSESYYIFPYPY